MNELDSGLKSLGCKHDIVDLVSHEHLLQAHGKAFSFDNAVRCSIGNTQQDKEEDGQSLDDGTRYDDEAYEVDEDFESVSEDFGDEKGL